MKREIPQKVDAQFGFTDQSSSECAFRFGATLFRRTRSASFLSVTLTVGALGVLVPHQKAAASSGLSANLLAPTTSQSGLIQSRELGLSKNFNNSAELAKVAGSSGEEIKLESTLDWSETQSSVSSAESAFSTTPVLSGLTLSSNRGLAEESSSTTLLSDETLGKLQIADPSVAVSTSANALGQSLSSVETDASSTLTSDSARFHRIVPGENLTEIAEKYQISPDLIAYANGIQDPNLIEADRQLTIPSTALTLSAATTPLVLGALASGADLNPPVQIGTVGVSPATGPSPSTVEVRPNIDLSSTILPTATTPVRQASMGSMMGNEALKPALQSLGQPKGEPIALMLKAPTALHQNTASRLGSGSFPLMARRPAFPHVPMLDLPPLTSADQFLPSAMNNSRGSQDYIWPARGVLSSRYGWRWGRMHRGVDIAAPVGTPIVAAASGVVISAGWNDGGYGYLVKVRHPDQSVTLYAHNSTITTRVGAVVNQGEMIAQMGSTGRSTGPHCHFEIRQSGQGAVDPMAFLNKSQLLALN